MKLSRREVELIQFALSDAARHVHTLQTRATDDTLAEVHQLTLSELQALHTRFQQKETNL